MQSGTPAPVVAPAERPPGQEQGPTVGLRILRLFLYKRELTPLLITVGLFIYFTIRAGSAFTDSLSLSSAAGYAGPVAAIAVGEVLLLVLAEIDLSAGQVFLFTPWVEYWFHNLGLPVALSIVLALCVAGGVGAINGLITVRLNVPSFVTTLAMNFILFGLVLIYSAQTQATPIPLSTGTGFASKLMGTWLWSEILWVLAITIVAHVMLTRTRFGVRIIATGGNLVGAAEAGVPVRRVKVWCFVLCSLFAGLIGIVDAVKYGSLDPGNFGVDYILYAVGACVIGGTALTGGRGTIIGSVLGILILRVMRNGIVLVGVPGLAYNIFIGAIILGMMALHSWLERRHQAGT